MAQANMIGQSALMSHPSTDYDKAVSGVNTLMAHMVGSIDYISGGKGSSDPMHDERMAAVKRFQEYRKRVLKEHRENEKKKEDIKIQAVG